MTRKPQPWYTKFNHPAWSPRNGRNRKPNPPTHRDPADRASDGAGADDAADSGYGPGFSLRPGGITFIYPLHDPKPAIPYAGVRVGEIIGHRMWYITQHYELCSLAHIFIWDPGTVINGDVDKVVMDQSHLHKPIYGGTYSYHTDEHMLSAVAPLMGLKICIPFNHILVIGIALGTIKCWGEVVEHEKGYRAQYARLQSIDGVIGNADINILKARYHV